MPSIPASIGFKEKKNEEEEDVVVGLLSQNKGGKVGITWLYFARSLGMTCTSWLLAQSTLILFLPWEVELRASCTYCVGLRGKIESED